MFTILDGRTELWQWDLNRKVVVEDATITEVHFCNGVGDCSLVCSVRTENGKRIADIPNILLQEHPQCKLRGFFELRVFAYCGEDYTKAEDKIKVNARTKPDDYEYTETEIHKGGKSAYEIWLDEGNTGTEADFLESLKGGKGDVGKSAYQYAQDGGYTGTEAEFAAKLAETEKDPTVPSWAKASKKPTYSANEINYGIPTEDESVVKGQTVEDALVSVDTYLLSLPAWSKQANKPTYTKSDVGLGNVDNVRQYSASNPPPYPVTSVNGKTGAVSLAAADVGALASASYTTKNLVVTYDDGTTETVVLVVAK